MVEALWTPNRKHDTETQPALSHESSRRLVSLFHCLSMHFQWMLWLWVSHNSCKAGSCSSVTGTMVPSSNASNTKKISPPLGYPPVNILRNIFQRFQYTSTSVAGKESAPWAVPRNLLELKLYNFCKACWLFNLEYADLVETFGIYPPDQILQKQTCKSPPKACLPNSFFPTGSKIWTPLTNLTHQKMC